MQATTKTAIKAILRADASIDDAARQAIEAALCERPKAPGAEYDPLLKRIEVADVLKCTPRTVDNLRAQGLLRAVVFPGRTRGQGFRRADVFNLIERRDTALEA